MVRSSTIRLFGTLAAPVLRGALALRPSCVPPYPSDCSEPRYLPFQLLSQYAPAESWCSKYHPVTTVTVTVSDTTSPTTDATTTTVTDHRGRAERRDVARPRPVTCSASDYLCSIYGALTNAAPTFAGAMCTCIESAASTVTVTATPTGALCTSTSPSPTSLTCGTNYIYSSSSEDKLLEIGKALTPADCAANCASTSECLSFSYSAPNGVGILGICDLYSESVADLNTDGVLLPVPTVGGQEAQAFYDLGCFTCAATVTTTAPPLSTTTTTVPGKAKAEATGS